MYYTYFPLLVLPSNQIIGRDVTLAARLLFRLSLALSLSRSLVLALTACATVTRLLTGCSISQRVDVTKRAELEYNGEESSSPSCTSQWSI